MTVKYKGFPACHCPAMSRPAPPRNAQRRIHERNAMNRYTAHGMRSITMIIAIDCDRKSFKKTVGYVRTLRLKSLG